MIRKLSLAVAVATALSPVGAFALGLGEIHSNSALYQKFNAEIDLLSVKQEEIQDIRVNLASQEAFDRAGVERLFLLSDLKFQPAYNTLGKPVITISSGDPIREPFLNFLLEVNWPKGRMVREYTILLDPPVTINRAAEPVSAPRISRAPTTQMGAVPSRRDSSMLTSNDSMGGREYGPVQPNDNLWTIAKMLRNSDESIEQVMMALQRNNPDAFINNNVNNLKVGKVLRLPAGTDVTAMSRQAAREEFIAQTRAWRRGKSSMTSSTTGTKSTTSSARDRLKLISAKPGTDAEALRREGDAEVARLEQEILLVRESNESTMQENDALRTRVQELEKQIDDIQRLMTLRSDELSQMQQAQQIASEKMEQLPSSGAEPTPPVDAEPPVTAEPIEEPVVATEEEPAVVPVPEGTDIQETNIEEVIEETAQAETAETPMPGETAATEKPQGPEVAQVIPKPAPVETPPAPMPDKKVSYFDNIGGNTTLLGIVGAVAVLLIGMLWMIMRRRKEAEAEFAESILVSPDSEIATAGKDEGDSLSEPSDETSFMSDFSPSDIDALQDETGEVDPLSEADVYIAYGRYQQAEELVKQAIEKFPDREELKHKLLEIYFSAKKGKEFTKLAEELHGRGLENSNPDVWSKVTSMGKELNPTHALFAGAAGAAGSALGGDELEDLGLDLEASFEEVSKPLEQARNDDLDSMDLSGLDNLDEMDSESLVGDMALDSEFLDKMEAGDSTTEEALDIDLDMAESSSATENAGAVASESSETAIELDDSESLDNMDLESIERELEGLSDDLDGEVADSMELPDDEASDDISLDLDSTDEVATKLDLARAYLDMGDNEGAKGILEEVVSEGDDQQKQEAQELLGNIGA